MKRKTIKTHIAVYPSDLQLSPAQQQLLAKAKRAIRDAYAPYSGFCVGAAVLLDNGKTIQGANQENAAYSVCLCAERVALANAAMRYPKAKAISIAISAKAPTKKIKEPVAPCGTCRQYMLEVENKNQQSIEVIMQGEEGQVYVVDTIQALLPISFDGSFL